MMIRITVLALALVGVFGGFSTAPSTCRDGQWLDFVGAYMLPEWKVLGGEDAEVLPASSRDGNVTDCLKFVANNDVAHICVEIPADGELDFRVDDDANNRGTFEHYFVLDGPCAEPADLTTTCNPSDDDLIPIILQSFNNVDPPANVGIEVKEGQYFCFKFNAPINVDLWCAPQAPGFSFSDMMA